MLDRTYVDESSITLVGCGTGFDLEAVVASRELLVRDFSSLAKEH
jgi:hypothetical protein